MFRLIVSIILQYYMHIISVDPNLGNEMCKSCGDNKNVSGNNFITALKRRIHITIGFILLILSIYYRSEDSMSIMDYIYFLLASIGVSGCIWTYDVLGKFYTFTIGIRNDHKLITSGPYMYIMHPGYAFQLLIFINTFLFYHVNFFITLLLLVHSAYVFGVRIVEEELMLESHFGANFNLYKSKRCRLIPYVF